MPAQRDPLSVRYDAAAERAVTRAIQAGGRWTDIELRPPDAARADVVWRSFGIWLWAPGRGFYARQHGEYAWMTAFRRACYYDPRIYLHDYSAGPDGRNPLRSHALKWGGWARRRTLLGRRRVIARIRVFSIRAASAYASTERPHHD